MYIRVAYYCKLVDIYILKDEKLYFYIWITTWFVMKIVWK